MVALSAAVMSSTISTGYILVLGSLGWPMPSAWPASWRRMPARAAGGIVIVSGLQRLFTSALDRVALNPQPLPPKIFFGRFGH